MGGEDVEMFGKLVGEDVFFFYEIWIYGVLLVRSEIIGYMLKLLLFCCIGFKLWIWVNRFMSLLFENIMMDLGDILFFEDLVRIVKISFFFIYIVVEFFFIEFELVFKINDEIV